MLVRCPECRTTYKVSEEVLKGNNPAFRCSRCRHTFELDLQAASNSGENETPSGAVSTAAAADELKLPFEPNAAESDATDTDRLSASGSRAPADESPKEGEASSESWSISDAGREDLQAFVMSDSERSIEPRNILDRSQDFRADDPLFANPEIDKDSDNVLAMASYTDQRASILPFLTLFGLLVIAFTGIAVLTYAHPLASEQMIKGIPLVGPSVVKNDHLKEGIVLQSLRSGYQTIQGHREVFLITGMVRNQNPVTVREVRLSAMAYDEAGKELEQQSIWAGNTISPKIIRGMTLEDIPHLQNLKPLKSFEIPPGDTVPFTIVFLKSAKKAAQFSYEVVSAEGDV